MVPAFPITITIPSAPLILEFIRLVPPEDGGAVCQRAIQHRGYCNLRVAGIALAVYVIVDLVPEYLTKSDWRGRPYTPMLTNLLLYPYMVACLDFWEQATVNFHEDRCRFFWNVKDHTHLAGADTIVITVNYALGVVTLLVTLDKLAPWFACE